MLIEIINIRHRARARRRHQARRLISRRSSKVLARTEPSQSFELNGLGSVPDHLGSRAIARMAPQCGLTRRAFPNSGAAQMRANPFRHARHSARRYGGDGTNQHGSEKPVRSSCYGLPCDFRGTPHGIRSLLYRTVDGILDLIDTPPRIVRRNLCRFRHGVVQLRPLLRAQSPLARWPMSVVICCNAF